MGVENNKIALLFAQEGLLIGIIALVVGIFGGILTNKLFLMALVKVSNINAIMKFEISTPAILVTSLMFLVILICVFIKEYIILLRTDITKLINATNIYQIDNSKNKTLQGLLGLIVIIFAYQLIIYYKKYNIQFPIAIIGTVVLVIIGTMLSFKGFFTFIISKLINNKNFLYKSTNVLSFNNIIFRIRDNNKVLGQITVLITCCLTCIIVSISMKTLFSECQESEYPYSIMYLGDSNDTIVNQALTLSKEEVDFKFDTEVMLVETNENPNEMGPIPYTDDVDLIKYSSVEEICEYRNLENEKRFLDTKLKNNEAIFLIPKQLINAVNFNVKFKLGDKDISIIDSYTMNLFGTFREGKPIIIVNDDTYDSISKAFGSEKERVSCITLKNFENTANISKYIEDNSNIHVYSVDNFDKESYNFVNSIYFIGLFLSLVFIVSIGSIMYFKCISDASKDKPRFDTLRKIGTSQEYINKSIFKQVGIFFLLPGLVAIIHSIVAGYSVTSFFKSRWKNIYINNYISIFFNLFNILFSYG